jgi:hypothetical protein
MSLIGGLVLCTFGGLLAFAGVRRLFTAISLYRNDAVPIRNVAGSDAPVEFEGRAESRADEDAFEAPFSGEPALCCEVWMETADQYRTDADGTELLGPEGPERQRHTRQSWLLAESDDARRPFVVRDGGARAVVDPAEATLDIADHMGEAVLTVGAGESLSQEARERLAALDGIDAEFDGSTERWDREDDRVQYREARLEPDAPVHVAGGAVRSTPDQWGSGVTATVGPSDADRFLLSEGTESNVVRENLVQFSTGVTVGLVLVALGLRAAGVGVLP